MYGIQCQLAQGPNRTVGYKGSYATFKEALAACRTRAHKWMERHKAAISVIHNQNDTYSVVALQPNKSDYEVAIFRVIEK